MSLKRSIGLMVAMVATVALMAVSAMAGDFVRRHETCSGGNCGGVARAIVQAPVNVAQEVTQAVRQEVQVIRNEVANVIAPSAPYCNQPQPVCCCKPQPSACCQSKPLPSSGGLAQQKSDKQAASGRMYHVGGSLGGATYEGVGFSTAGPDQAIAASCYWGQKTPVDIGVSCNNKGCFATVLYQ